MDRQTSFRSISADLITFIRSVMGVFNSHQKELEHALRRLGWEHYTGDLWKHKKSGVTVGFQDAIVMELRASVQEKKPFEKHFFKEPY